MTPGLLHRMQPQEIGEKQVICLSILLSEGQRSANIRTLAF